MKAKCQICKTYFETEPVYLTPKAEELQVVVRFCYKCMTKLEKLQKDLV